MAILQLFWASLENVYIDFLFDFILDVITVTILSYNIYYKRYHDKESFISFMLFNVFVFVVITVLFNTSDTMSMGLWFGLFAILSIVTLRSESLSKREITYFFWTLSIAIINSIWLTDYALVIICNFVVILWAWVIDNPKILEWVYSNDIILDYIPEDILYNKEHISAMLSEKFHVGIISYSVVRIDYVKDMIILKISYRINKNIPIEVNWKDKQEKKESKKSLNNNK